MKQSIIARKIDMEFKMKREAKIRKFKKEYCSKCKNKDTDLCCITIMIDDNAKCVEYEEKY